MRIRRARASDVEAIHRLISAETAAGALLPRTPEEIRDALPVFHVAVVQGNIAGCVAIQSYSGALAEIRSLVVAQEMRGAGVGEKLLGAAIQHARRKGIARLLAVTRSDEFFERNGFARLPGGMPAEKVERDCAHCPKAAGCRLVALALEFCPARATAGIPLLQPAGLERLPGPAPA
jgi:amino-acid N-acetyltransferase